MKVILTRPSCWGTQLKSKTLDLVYVPIGHPMRVLRNGEPAAENMGECATPEGCELLLKAFEEHRPDMFLYPPHHGVFDLKLMARLRKVASDCVFVHLNGNHVLGPHNVCWFVHKFRDYVDVVLTSTTDAARKKLFRKWCYWVGTLYTFGFDPHDFGPPTVEPVYDCFFGGGNSVHPGKRKGKYEYSWFRHRLIMGLYKRKKNLLIRGGGTWKYYDVPYKPGIMDSVPYYREMQKAKIVLGTYHDDLERRYSKRTVYGGASGRLFMTRYIVGMEKDFKNHENIVWFRELEEAYELVDHYLKNDRERERVARQTRAHFVEHHSWRARLRDFEAVAPVAYKKAARRSRK